MMKSRSVETSSSRSTERAMLLRLRRFVCVCGIVDDGDMIC